MDIEQRAQAVRTAPALTTDRVKIRSSSRWRRSYARLLATTDAIVIVWAVAGAYLMRLGLGEQRLAIGGRTFSPSVTITYLTISIALAVVWWFALVVTDSRQPAILGEGAEEYKRIYSATFAVFGGLAIVGFLLHAEVARGYLAIAFPAGLIGLSVSRAMCRELLRTRRRAGFSCTRAIVVGAPLHVRHIIADLADKQEAGYDVVGVCLDDAGQRGLRNIDGVPVLGDTREALDLLDMAGANALIVTASAYMGPNELQRVGWMLEDSEAELIMSPALTNIAGPRIHMRPVAGLPLIHVEGPRLPRSGAIVKNTFDRVGSLCIIVLLAPVLIGVALAVRLTSSGPALFLQERVGENGEPFKVFKFRSMVVNADAQLAKLLAEQGAGDKPLFKPENDPRITKVGAFIRKYSLDELPQLFNVLFGSMSLVGPRPQRAAEVALYEDGAERRLLCKPGMTGLWQVSGRSDMPWDRAVRLDLYYVENWSFTFDLLLLWRTIGVVLKGSGAR